MSRTNLEARLREIVTAHFIENGVFPPAPYGGQQAAMCHVANAPLHALYNGVLTQCTQIATCSPTPMWEIHVHQYLSGTTDSRGRTVNRTFREMLHAVEYNIKHGINPDDVTRDEPVHAAHDAVNQIGLIVKEWFTGHAMDMESEVISALSTNLFQARYRETSDIHRALGEMFAAYLANKSPAVADEHPPETQEVIQVSTSQQEVYQFYRKDVYYVISREYGVSLAGNPFGGAWVMRNFHSGEYVDHDRYLADLAERYNLKINRS